MAEVGVREAKARLSELIERVERGEVVTLTRRGRAVARLVPIGRRRPGGLRGRIGMAPDFDDTPEWLIRAFEGQGDPA